MFHSTAGGADVPSRRTGMTVERSFTGGKALPKNVFRRNRKQGKQSRTGENNRFVGTAA
jgi:hypothetical protein